ncbi:HD domain-containing phosphohydrolase [Desulfoplanes sp.]
MEKKKILFVDDDTNILSTFKRIFRSKYIVDTAVGPVNGLHKLNAFGPYCVVVADMKMPKMDGIEFLHRVKEVFPDTVRIMLTGYADTEVAVNAINNGEIFRFLNKPCSQTEMLKALEAAVAHHELLVSERELLEKTLTGTVEVLMELISLTSPTIMGRIMRIKRHVSNLAMHLKQTDIWMYETAAMLSQIGCITMDDALLKKIDAGKKLTAEDHKAFNQHVLVAADIVRKIPRMDQVAEIITYQHKSFDGQGYPLDDVKGGDIPLGSRILRIAIDFDRYVAQDMSYKAALVKMKEQLHRYDIDIFRSFIQVLQMEEKYSSDSLTLDHIHPGMILLEDIIGLNGTTLLKKGSEITEGIATKLHKLEQIVGIKQPIEVMVPPALAQSSGPEP